MRISASSRRRRHPDTCSANPAGQAPPRRVLPTPAAPPWGGGRPGWLWASLVLGGWQAEPFVEAGAAGACSAERNILFTIHVSPLGDAGLTPREWTENEIVLFQNRWNG